jgi:hypothetical protein
MKSRLLLSVLVLCVAAATARAGRDVQPIPISPPGTIPSPEPINDEHAGNCLTVYLNETTQTGGFTQQGFEFGDDVHTIVDGDWPLCAFDIGYFMSTEGPGGATVTIYRGDAADNAPGAVIGGPYAITVPSSIGNHAVHIEVTSGIIGPDVWMGVRFAHANAGLLTMDPPSVGLSHDLDTFSGQVFQSPYSGNPVANYYLGLYASPPTGTHASTWGEVKATYR